jgi:NAD dependent epimerase/dehydratase family
MNLVVFGLGYSSLRFVELFGDRFARISGTVRTSEKRERLGQFGIDRRLDLHLFEGGVQQPEIAARTTEANIVLVSVPPGQAGDPVLAAFGETLRTGPARVVYLSTVGVYGDHQGAWIDERTDAMSGSERAKARLAAEAGWRTIAGTRLAILRLAGIYGPERNALARLRDGSARRIIKSGQVFNRIHVDDIARAIMAAMAGKASGVFNICDDEPAPPQDVIAYAAQLLGLAPPPDQDYATAEMTAMARSFYATSNRIRNTRAKRDLGLELAFPTYREGLDRLWRDGEGCSGKGDQAPRVIPTSNSL